MQTDTIGGKDDLNLYAYTHGDPLNNTDPQGTETPCVTNGGCSTPTAPTAAQVVGAVNTAITAVQVLSVVTGPAAPIEIAGEQALKTAVKDAVEGAVDKGVAKEGVEKAAGKETGSYTNTHESGKEYHGKGDRERSQTSGKRVEKETGDRHTATEWKPSSSQRQAFKDEASRIEQGGGVESPANYNQINSPGARYTEEDSGPP